MQTLAIGPWPILFQLLCCFCLSKDPSIEHSERLQRREDASQGLIRTQEAPKSRVRFPRRSLTPPPSLGRGDKVSASKKYDLLSLPLELRQLVWEEVLGGMKFHLVVRFHILDPPKLAYFVCRSRNLHNMCGEQSTCRLYGGRDSFPEPRLLPLLLTCHQTYSDTVNYIYSRNCFHTWTSDCIQYLPQLILPNRLNSIHHLQFEWEIPGEPPYPLPHPPHVIKERYKIDVWDGVWSALAQMKGLQVLRIKLKVDTRSWETLAPDREKALLQPIHLITAPALFELIVPFTPRVRYSYWERLPCRILSVAQFY